MRKLWITVLLLCLLPVFALAQDAVPAEVQALIDEYYGQRLPAEYVEIVTEDGCRAGIAIIEGMSVLGFENADGTWKITLQTFVMDELCPARVAHVPGDDLAIHITKEDGTARLTYRFDGTEFRLAGWQLPGYDPVTVEGDILRYGYGANVRGERILPGGVTDWPFYAEDLPLTMEEAMARAVISEQNAADMFPGYTMRGYTAFNDGRMAEAVYSRIDSGMLLIRRAGLNAGYDPQWVDCMPIPLSAALLTRLQLEPFDELISCWLGGDTFLTQDAFSREAFPLPAGAVILQNRVEAHSLVVLAEVEGVKRLYVFENGHVNVSQPLPEDVYLDFFHAGSGNIQLEWAQQNMSASFVRRADGRWLLSWCTCYGPAADIHFSTNAFGVWTSDENADVRLRVGTFTSSADLFTVNLEELTGAEPILDQSGWAVVNNPDPADRLHLRTKASRSGTSLGKFYNGTPVMVLERRGDWTRVQIGFGNTARTGWMMTKYLAFGADMDRVDDAFPDLTFREEYITQEEQLGYGYMVVGVEEEGRTKQYILLGTDGTVMYVPQTWLWGGNG